MLHYAEPSLHNPAPRATVVLLWAAVAYALSLSAMMVGSVAWANLSGAGAAGDCRGSTQTAVGLGTGPAVDFAVLGLFGCGFVQIVVLAVGGGTLLRHPSSRSAAWAMVAFAAAATLCVAVEIRLDFVGWMLD